MRNKIKSFKLFEADTRWAGQVLEDGRTILDVLWRGGRDTIGIVAVKLEHGDQWTAYMGVAKGHDEASDIQSIADYGTRLLPNEAMGFFPNIEADPKNYKV